MLASPERDISESLQKTLNTKNLFDLYFENYSKEKRDEFRAKFSAVGENPEKFVAFPDNPKAFFVYRKEPYSVSVPCKLIESCPDYNRTDSIDFKQCIKNLEKYGNKFVCEAADEDGNPITLWYDSKRGVFRTTRGNHRTIMKLLTDGQEASIEAYVKVHNPDSTDDQMFDKEATSFDSDNQQKGQNKTSLYKGQLFNALTYPDADQWPVIMFNYLDNLPTPVGIAGTNKGATVQIDGYSAIWKRMEEIKDEKNLVDPYDKLSVVLNNLVEYAVPVNKKTGIKDGTIKSDAIEHMLVFKESFKTTIERVDNDNGIDSFSQFVNYIFNKRSNKTNGLLDNLTMKTLTLNSTQIRNIGWYIAGLCTLYNEYIKVNGLKKGHATKEVYDTMAINNNSAEWNSFLDKNVPLTFRKAVEGRLSDIYR